MCDRQNPKIKQRMCDRAIKSYINLSINRGLTFFALSSNLKAQHPLNPLHSSVAEFPMGIVVEDVSKQFGSFQALDRVSLKIESGSLVALLGLSLIHI
jgi:hypothetical protein